MPKFSTIKFFDRALLPIVVLVGMRLLTFFLATLIFNLEWQVNLSQLNFSTGFLEFKGEENLILAKDLATTASFLVIATGFGWILYQANYLNVSLLHPHEVKKHVANGRENLLTTNFDTFHQEIVWLVLGWVVFVISSLDFFSGYLSLTVFSLGAAVILLLLATFSLVLEKSLRYSKKTVENK